MGEYNKGDGMEDGAMATQKQARTRRDIIMAMERLLSEQKFEVITINDICQEALITRSTFYRYFLDKYELTEALIQYLGERDLIMLDQGSLIAQVTKFVDKNVKIINNLNPSNQHKMNFYVEFVKLVENSLQAYFEINHDHQDDPFIRLFQSVDDRDLWIKFVAGGLSSIIINNPNPDDHFRQKEIIDFISELTDRLVK